MLLKRWLLFIVVFTFSLTVVLGLIIYFQAKAPFKDVSETTEAYVIENKLLAQVDESYVYNSSSSIQTVIGTDAKGEEKAIFLPEKQTEDDIVEVKMKDGISKEEAIELAMKDETDSKLLHAKLGVEEIGPVWEITYVNKTNKLNYVYLLFENGDWWKRISNL